VCPRRVQSTVPGAGALLPRFCFVQCSLANPASFGEREEHVRRQLSSSCVGWYMLQVQLSKAGTPGPQQEQQQQQQQQPCPYPGGVAAVLPAAHGLFVAHRFCTTIVWRSVAAWLPAAARQGDVARWCLRAVGRQASGCGRAGGRESSSSRCAAGVASHGEA
jgi:hypothetical protein